MSKGNLFKQIAIPAVGVGVGVEGIYKALKGDESLTYDEMMAKLKTEPTTKRVLRASWSLIKVATLLVKTSDVLRNARK